MGGAGLSRVYRKGERSGAVGRRMRARCLGSRPDSGVDGFVVKDDGDTPAPLCSPTLLLTGADETEGGVTAVADLFSRLAKTVSISKWRFSASVLITTEAGVKEVGNGKGRGGSTRGIFSASTFLSWASAACSGLIVVSIFLKGEGSVWVVSVAVTAVVFLDTSLLFVSGLFDCWAIFANIERRSSVLGAAGGLGVWFFL